MWTGKQTKQLSGSCVCVRVSWEKHSATSSPHGSTNKLHDNRTSCCHSDRSKPQPIADQTSTHFALSLSLKSWTGADHVFLVVCSTNVQWKLPVGREETAAYDKRENSMLIAYVKLGQKTTLLRSLLYACFCTFYHAADQFLIQNIVIFFSFSV